MVYWSYEYPEPPHEVEAFAYDFYKGQAWKWRDSMSLKECLHWERKYLLWKLYGHNPEIKVPPSEGWRGSITIDPDRDDKDIPF